MRVSIVNCVSTAAEMMRYSDQSLFNNAHHDDFDYVVVKWLASPEVDKYLEELQDSYAFDDIPRKPLVHVIEHKTDDSIGFVPNLREMMNEGFVKAFELNQYAGLANTDCYFGPYWLKNLVQYAEPELVVNSLHITAATAPNPVMGIVTEDLGIPIQGKFNLSRFIELFAERYKDQLVFADQLNTSNGYRECATMPYLFHHKWWEKCGPWEPKCVDGQSPDVRFFDRLRDGGARYALALNSIVYHAEAIERRSKRPVGTENLPEE